MTTSTTMMSPEIRETFARDGAAVVRGFVTSAWLELLAEAAEEIRRNVKSGSAAPEDNPAVSLSQKRD